MGLGRLIRLCRRCQSSVQMGRTEPWGPASFLYTKLSGQNFVLEPNLDFDHLFRDEELSKRLNCRGHELKPSDYTRLKEDYFLWKDLMGKYAPLVRQLRACSEQGEKAKMREQETQLKNKLLEVQPVILELLRQPNSVHPDVPQTSSLPSPLQPPPIPTSSQDAKGLWELTSEWKHRLWEAGFELVSLPAMVRPAVVEAAMHPRSTESSVFGAEKPGLIFPISHVEESDASPHLIAVGNTLAAYSALCLRQMYSVKEKGPVRYFSLGNAYGLSAQGTPIQRPTVTAFVLTRTASQSESEAASLASLASVEESIVGPQLHWIESRAWRRRESGAEVARLGLHGKFLAKRTQTMFELPEKKRTYADTSFLSLDLLSLLH